MKKKVLTVLLTGAMVASMAAGATVVSAEDNGQHINRMGMGPELQYQVHADRS
jgi:peptidoglycan hydrolase CwlO-like protein